MKNYLLIAWHKWRMHSNKTIANSLAQKGGLVHKERMIMDHKYRDAYNKYTESKAFLQSVGKRNFPA